MAQAIQFSQVGTSDVLDLREIEVPTPAAGQVHVRVEAAGVNPIDWKLRSGIRPLAAGVEWHGTGQDGAGTIVSVGSGVEGFRVGDAVVFCGASSAYATDVVVGASSVFPRPANVSAIQGASVGIPAGTAYQVVRSLAISANDTVLVHGGSGSVGQAVIQFAVRLGATVVATASAARSSLVESLGAVAITYGDGLVDRARDAAPGGYTVAIDCAGTDEAINASLELVSDASRIGTIVRGADADRFGIRAWSGGAKHALTPEQQAWRLEAVPVTLSLMSAHAFDIEPGQEYSLADAAKAQDDSQHGAPGKLVIVPAR